jgi:hypothetical protein
VGLGGLLEVLGDEVHPVLPLRPGHLQGMLR